MNAAASTATLVDVAQRCANVGWFIFPLGVKSKLPDANLAPHGFKSASKDAEQIKKWWTASPDANIGIDLGRSNLTVLDFDNGLPPAEVGLQDKFQVSTSRGTHVYFVGISKQGDMYLNGQHIGEIKSEGGYVLSPFSVHPEGPVYTMMVKADITPLPDGLIDRLRPERKSSPTLEGEKIPRGQHDNELTRIAGKLRNDGMEEDSIYGAIVEVCEKRCEGYGSDYKEMCRKIAHSVCRYPVVNTDIAFTQQPSAAVAISSVEPEVSAERYAISQEEIDAEMEKDFPVVPLVEQAGPTWEDDMMYGVCGDIIRKASKYCESHPAGMYLDLVVSLGNIIGRKPYFNINQTRHYTNEFMARVGLTAESRKGTGRDVVDEILKLADNTWFTSRIMSGFGSAEAIINELRDSMQQQVRDKKAPDGFKAITVPGVTDKRLCIREGELASVFQLAGKKESRADIVLRDGWDGKTLRNLVKGKSRDGLSNSAICTEPHLSISGDTTRSELVAKMPSGAADNGFGNRFLYCYVYRTKLCPNGGPQLAWGPEITRLYEAIQWARELTYVPLTKSASKVWTRMYMELDEPKNKLPGLAGAMIARSAAHIRRLALIYTLLDEYDVVETRHLQAAKKMWDYCQESAKFIFTGTTADQDRIIGFVRRNREVTVPQITQEVFHKHKRADWVETQVNSLVQNRSAGITRRNDKIIAVG
jgi:Bifunctional DNA primase/polymerase, N-terminal/Protein of unknown function (DUF3987)